MKIPRALIRALTDVIATSPSKAAGNALLLMALTVIEGAGLVLLMPLLELVGINEPQTMPNVANWLTAGFGMVGLETSLGSVLLFFVGIAALRTGLTRMRTWVDESLKEDVSTRLRARIYRAIGRSEWRFLVTKRQSELVHVLTAETSKAAAAGFQVIDLLFAVGISLVYLGMAFHLSPVMAAVVLVCGALMASGGPERFAESRGLSRRAAEMRRKLHSAISEHVGSMKTAKSYGMVDRHAEIFLDYSRELRGVTLEAAAVEADFRRNLDFGSTVMLALIVYVSFEVLRVPAAQLLMLLYVFARVIPRLTAIHQKINGLAKVLAVLDRVEDIERECLAAAEPAPAGHHPLQLADCIRLENVSFCYLQRNDVPALCGVNLEIAAGLTVAIIGPSGAGKSTLADLLIGLLSPTEGCLLVDGQRLGAERLADWRRQVSYVPQETVLFHDTVRANLRWARADATDAELWDALRLASSEDFVRELPSGLDTVIGEGGVLVSGGERQRLSLARALVRRPRVLVLDEATSSLDSENEARIQQAVSGLHRMMTIVIITHRLSTIREADIIHVIDRGRLVESGTWNELMDIHGSRFRQLCHAQGIERRPTLASVGRP